MTDVNTQGGAWNTLVFRGKTWNRFSCMLDNGCYVVCFLRISKSDALRLFTSHFRFLGKSIPWAPVATAGRLHSPLPHACSVLKTFVGFLTIFRFSLNICSLLCFWNGEVCVMTSIFQSCQNKLRKMFSSPPAKCFNAFPWKQILFVMYIKSEVNNASCQRQMLLCDYQQLPILPLIKIDHMKDCVI